MLAGGSGSRVGRDTNKVYLPLRSRLVLEHSLQTFHGSGLFQRLVIVVRQIDRLLADELTGSLDPPPLTVVGGATRQQSEAAGLEAIAAEIEGGTLDLVAIHDGARPFATIALLRDLLDAASDGGGAIPTLPLNEPLFAAASGRLTTQAEPGLRRVQTPQVFSAPALLNAYRRATEAGFSGVDTAETMERFSDITIRSVPGDARNIKLTVVEDFFEAEELALRWQDGTWSDL